jgi:PAS domain S-box-containing protein
MPKYRRKPHSLERIGQIIFMSGSQVAAPGVETPHRGNRPLSSFLNACCIRRQREESLGRNFWELFPQSLGTELEKEFRRAAAGETRDFEHHYEPWERWYHNRCFPRKGGGISVFSYDITEHKEVEEALLAERQRLRSIIFAANVGTWEWNVQTGETVFNERWAEILGYTLAELAPVSIDTWTRLAHPDDLKVSDALLERHFRGDLDYYQCEARMRHKNGNWI